MKKLISLLLILCMACMLIPAVAEEALTGEWYLKSMKMGEQEYDATVLGVNVVMALGEDGSAAMTTPDSPDPVTGTWTLDGDQFTLNIEGEDPVSGTVTAEAIALEQEGQIMIFTREAPVAITVADAKAADSAEDFYGTYTIAYVDMEDRLMDMSGMGYTTGLVIGEGTFEILPTNDEDMMALTLGMFALTPTDLEDGVLKLTSATSPENVDGRIELLEDGMIKITTKNNSNQSSLVFYFIPAAAEEPAA